MKKNSEKSFVRPCPNRLASRLAALLAMMGVITASADTLTNGTALINYDAAAWNNLASAYGGPPVLTLDGYFDQTGVNARTSAQLLSDPPVNSSYTGQVYAMNGLTVTNLAGRTTQPTTFAYTPGYLNRHAGNIGLGGVSRFLVLGGLGGQLLYGDFTLQYDATRAAGFVSGWYLKGNIPPEGPLFDLMNVIITESTGQFTIAGDLGVTPEVAFLLYATPGDLYSDVGDFTFTAQTAASATQTAEIVSIVQGESNVVVSGASGTVGGLYALVSTTNIASPAAQWTTNALGTFDIQGASSNALTGTPSGETIFYRLHQQH